MRARPVAAPRASRSDRGDVAGHAGPGRWPPGHPCSGLREADGSLGLAMRLRSRASGAVTAHWWTRISGGSRGSIFRRFRADGLESARRITRLHRVTMDVRCERCRAQYAFEDDQITPAGLTVQCNGCGHVFRIKKKELVVTLPGQPGGRSTSCRGRPPRPSASRPCRPRPGQRRSPTTGPSAGPSGADPQLLRAQHAAALDRGAQGGARGRGHAGRRRLGPARDAGRAAELLRGGRGGRPRPGPLHLALPGRALRDARRPRRPARPPPPPAAASAAASPRRPPRAVEPSSTAELDEADLQAVGRSSRSRTGWVVVVLLLAAGAAAAYVFMPALFNGGRAAQAGRGAARRREAARAASAGPRAEPAPPPEPKAEVKPPEPEPAPPEVQAPAPKPEPKVEPEPKPKAKAEGRPAPRSSWPRPGGSATRG